MGQWPWTRVPRGLIFTDGWYHVSSVHVHHVEDDRATYGLDSALKLVITMDYVQHYNCLKMQTKKSLKIKINVCVWRLFSNEMVWESFLCWRGIVTIWCSLAHSLLYFKGYFCEVSNFLIFDDIENAKRRSIEYTYTFSFCI